MGRTEDMLAAIYAQQYGTPSARPMPVAPDRPTYNSGAGISGINMSPENLAYMQSQNPDLFPQANASVYLPPKPVKAAGTSALAAKPKRKKKPKANTQVPNGYKNVRRGNPKDRDARG